MRRATIVLFVLVSLGACAPADDGASVDAAGTDAAAWDGGVRDAAIDDAASPDDATPIDGAALDASEDAHITEDGGTSDAGVLDDDAGPDAGPSNTPPRLVSVALEPNPATSASTLTCVPGVATDDDGDLVRFAFAWTVNDAPIAATGATLAPSEFTTSDVLRCIVTPSDASSDGAPVSSSPRTIGNAPPSITSVSLTPALTHTGTPTTCVPSGVSDIEGDPVTLAFSWTIDDVPVAELSATLDGSAVVRGDRIRCTVTPSDASGVGAPVSSPARIVADSPPSRPIVTLSPSPPTDDDDLVCTASSSDADGDPIAYAYAWLRNGTSTTHTTSTIAAATTLPDDAWTCVATASSTTLTSSSGSASTTVLGAFVHVGEPVEIAGSVPTGPNVLFAQPIVLTSAAALHQVGAIFAATSTGDVQYAIYATDASGFPGALIAQTAVATEAPAGRLVLPITGAPVALAAGAYWIVFRNGGTLVTYAGTESTTSRVYYRLSYPFTDPFPATFAHNGFTNARLNVYVSVTF
ncbi:MAG: hypothetical protein M3Y87_27580 [Myxococcota bacterium]|nr:hypothetical protein [Myxococcota bacterium]